MADGDYRMPPEDYPNTLGSSGAAKKKGFGFLKSLFSAPLHVPHPEKNASRPPEDQPLPPEDTPPGGYIYTVPKKRSLKTLRKKALSSYGAAAGLIILLLTNLIPLIHPNDKVLPSGKLRILSVLTGFAGWQDESGSTLVFQENGKGYAYTNGIFTPLIYTGGEEAVTVRMKWAELSVGQGILYDSGEITIDNDNLKADGMNYTLSLSPDGEEPLEFRPLNILSLNTKYLDAFMEHGFSGLFADTEWLATTGGVEEMIPGPVYTQTLRFGKAGSEAGTLYAEGVFAVSPSINVDGNAAIDEPASYNLLFREGDPEVFGQAFEFSAAPDQWPVRARYTINNTHHVLEDGGTPLNGVVLVTEEGCRLSWIAPFDHHRTYQPQNGGLFPDGPSGPGGGTDPADETEEPTEEPRDVFATLTSVPGWVSDDGAYYSFHEDGTGWVYLDGYFGMMTFEGDESRVDFHFILNAESSEYSDEKEELIASVSKYESFHMVTSDAFSEDGGVLTCNLESPGVTGDPLFRATDRLPDTAWLDTFLEEEFSGLNHKGYWFIMDDYVPEADNPTPYVQFINFNDDSSLAFSFQTTEPVEFTSRREFDVDCALLDPVTYEFSILEKMEISYRPSGNAGGYSSFTHTQEPKDGHIRLLIREEGLFVYSDVPMGRPNLYEYREGGK
ncbi:MAG: hypothetical protein IKG97_04810 [Lachnospiraceae bacterium]|nr:hypothetical protein [Lachnospiraceae bacterium]